MLKTLFSAAVLSAMAATPLAAQDIDADAPPAQRQMSDYATIDYNLQEDRTELNDLKKEHPERAQKMIEEWFRIAKNVDRLKPNQLKRGNGTLSPLKFGKRNDPGAEKGTGGKGKQRKKSP